MASVIIRALLRTRNLVAATAVGSGYVIKQKLENIQAWYNNQIDGVTWLEKPSKYISSIYNSSQDRYKHFKDYTSHKLIPIKSYFTELDQEDYSNNDADQKLSVNINNLVDEIKRLKVEISTINFKYKEETEKLKDEYSLTRQELLRTKMRYKDRKNTKTRFKKPLIDLYSELLDELNDYAKSYATHDSNDKNSMTLLLDRMPRVVVAGDQSSGKTSVLEMLAQARIFPRGGGEMMTRCPVQVTLSEGPYHIARFPDDDREYDLTNENDTKDLRNTIKLKMTNLIGKNETVSQHPVSLSVSGPELHRMVLVDLPGVISTVTQDIAKDTPQQIKSIYRKYLSNPNAIILYVQDGSIDAERTNATDHVMQADPQGKRTICVLTKVDEAERQMIDRTRIFRILNGTLLPLKALGYYAVVTGRGNQQDTISEIQQYEESFFRKCSLMNSDKNDPKFKKTKESNVPINMADLYTRTGTPNLSKAVSSRFWKIVEDSVEEQAEVFRALSYNLNIQWKNTYGSSERKLNRFELFDLVYS
ncbi:hypothetical protein A3Q56_00708 [Intoshia linei]|uniref:Dynamin-type G domain-containing protein n=1 Tax=Intoshia linei TaxID=1819745 RepID=A0A177BB39_9BILA|nr:hypothetical protein A3Q56_00708 [Intoshia linei]